GSLGFDEGEVVLGPDSILGDQVAHPLLQDAIQLRAGESQFPAPPTIACGNRAGDLVEPRAEVRLDLFAAQLRGKQAHPAVDVEADPARGDHAFGIAGGGHPAHGEAVALVHIGHPHGRRCQAREGGHVHELRKAAVAPDLLQELGAREDPGRYPHIAAKVLRDLPDLRCPSNRLGCSCFRMHPSLLRPQTSSTTAARVPSSVSSIERPWKVAAFTEVLKASGGPPSTRAESFPSWSSMRSTTGY